MAYIIQRPKFLHSTFTAYSQLILLHLNAGYNTYFNILEVSDLKLNMSSHCDLSVTTQI